MKIAVSARGDTLDPQFGRAQHFIVYDDADKTYANIDNRQNCEQAHGAGISAAKMIADNGVTHVITGSCGPKALRVLQSAGIDVIYMSIQPVKEALSHFLNEQGSSSPSQ